MSSKTDIFEERADVFKNKTKDIFEERAEFYQKESEPSSLQEIPSQTLKGGLKGFLGTYGDILESVGMREVASKQLGLPTEFFQIPTSSEIGSVLEKLGLPTEPQSVGGRYASRVGESLGGALAFGAPVGSLGAFGAGSLLGQTAEELGASESVGGLVELLGTLGTGALRGKVLPKGKKAQDLVSRARKLGLTEKEISPLIKPKGRFQVASKVARKTGKLGEMAQRIETKLGDSYDAVKNAAKSAGSLSVKERRSLLNSLENKIKGLKKSHSLSSDKKSALNILEESTKSIRNKFPTYESLIESYQDINKSPKGVRNILKSVKEEYNKILSKKSPELGKDFEATNKLYAQFKDRLAKLKPNQYDALWDKIEILGVGTGLASALLGNPWGLKAALGPVAARSFANQYLTNPWFQNLGNKFINALVKNDTKTARALVNSLKKILKQKYDVSEKEIEEE